MILSLPSALKKRPKFCHPNTDKRISLGLILVKRDPGHFCRHARTHHYCGYFCHAGIRSHADKLRKQ